LPNDSGVEQLKHVDRELKERYEKVLEDKEQLGKLESELDTLIEELEKQKKDVFSDPNNAAYAYVTYEDLENLPIWNNNQTSSTAPDAQDSQPNQDEQSLVIAIQTPHGSHLNIYH